MRFVHCPHCGEKLIPKQIGDEGLIPYCEQCRVPLWDMFTTCVICAVVNEQQEVALLRQGYVSTYGVCVAGVMKLGESAEDCAIREIGEELGLAVEKLDFIHSYPYLKKEMLMLGFRAQVKKAPFTLSGEVDSAQWVPLGEALSQMREGSIAWQLVRSVIQQGPLS